MKKNGTTTKKLSDLTPDPRNANRGTERGLQLLEKSMGELGAGRSILIDKNGRIIAGNKTAETAGSIGLDNLIVVQTDGTQLVAVQRTDLDLERDVRARELAYADNRVGQLDLDWNAEQIAADMAEIDGLELPGWTEDEMNCLLGGQIDQKQKVTCPNCGHEF